jgi:hypothetical protein
MAKNDFQIGDFGIQIPDVSPGLSWYWENNLWMQYIFVR